MDVLGMVYVRFMCNMCGVCVTYVYFVYFCVLRYVYGVVYVNCL